MKRLSDYVNPYIGTISHMLQTCRPEVMLPYSPARSTPLVSGCSDYFCSDVLVGYPLGGAYVTPGRALPGGDSFDNTIDHSLEDFRCYYQRTELEEMDIVAESTVTEHVYLHRFTGADRLKLTAPGGSIAVEDGLILAKALVPRGKEMMQYIAVSLDAPLPPEGTAGENSGENGAILVLGVPESGVTVRGAVSLISFESAKRLLAEETEGLSFDVTAEKAQQIWDDQLSKIRVSGNTEAKKTVFYTALYRAFQRMTNYTEDGRYYSNYDGKVHEGTFYTGDGLWDTFRCMHPLQLIVDGERHRDILESYNLMYKQSGLMPSFPGISGDSPVMIGFHAASLFADALAKGVEADYRTAFEGILKNAETQAMMPWCCGADARDEDRCYYEKGFFPALKKGETETSPLAVEFEKRQAISVTLEHAYDDWCAGKIAEALGKHELAEKLYARGQNYRRLYNPEVGLMCPKSADGEWVEDFDPIYSGGPGGRDYTTENNTYTYTWSVFHDPEGLGGLMGGPEAAAAKLDDLFRHNTGDRWKYSYMGQYPDATGLMGQFAMGNEPDFHIPYLYDYYGAPWKAQKKLRDLMDIWFTDGITGICGDEDGGAMSSWFVFSAAGFYPVCPGKAEYAIGTPLFDEAVIDVGGGKSFTVTARGAGDGLRYIQSAELNGRPLSRPFLAHEDLTAGGELVLVMGRKPNKEWGK
ncbi:MAG: GH92 family glycosyl hydrolase [Lachnospiraceae bacterium]|nr:GH92 family glycosyl hydrolase [Lachnospiraceae bacterium]